jgi:hypothetical protein
MKTIESFNNIIDVITCVDGGIQFTKFKMFVDTLIKQADHNDIAAKEILNYIEIFNKLIEISQKEGNKQ